MYTINTVREWSGSTMLEDLRVSETDSTLDAFVLRTYTHNKKPWHRRIAATLTALSLALTLAACGDKPENHQDDGGVDACAMYCDSGNGSEGGEGGSNHPPNAIDDGSVTPANNTNYNVGDTIPTGFTSPSDPDGDSLDGKVVLSAPTQSFTKEFPLGTLTPGTHYGVDIDSATANGGSALPATSTGTAYTIDLVVSDGKGGESKVTRNVTLKGFPTDRPYVKNCSVVTSHVGSALTIPCEGADPTGGSLVGNWTVLTDISGVVMIDADATHADIRKASGVYASDVGLHTYTVKDGNGTKTSDSFIFTVPVDEHYSTLILHCTTGTNNTLLLPETSVDAVASSCGTGFNAANKPATNAQPAYVLDVSASCVPGAISALTAAEQEAHKHYNLGKTVSDVYSSCTIDFAQVSYIHH